MFSPGITTRLSSLLSIARWLVRRYSFLCETVATNEEVLDSFVRISTSFAYLVGSCSIGMNSLGPSRELYLSALLKRARNEQTVITDRRRRWDVSQLIDFVPTSCCTRISCPSGRHKRSMSLDRPQYETECDSTRCLPHVER